MRSSTQGLAGRSKLVDDAEVKLGDRVAVGDKSSKKLRIRRALIVKVEIPVRLRTQKSLFIRDGINKKKVYYFSKNPSIVLQRTVTDISDDEAGYQ